MPILIAIGGLGAVAGGIAGFWAGGGAKAATDGIKYAALGIGAVIVAKQMGWLK